MSQGHWQKRRESFEGAGVEGGRNYKPRREGSAERAGQKQNRPVQRGGERKEKEPQSQPRGISTSQEVREKVWQQGEEGIENISDDSVLNDDKIDNCNVFKVLYTNARSIVGKIDLLRTYVYDLKPSLVCICEASTNNSISDAYLSLDGYNLVVRADGTDTKEGWCRGLLIFVKAGIMAARIDSLG